MAEQSHQDSFDQVATSLTGAVHVTPDLRAEVEAERVREVVFFAPLSGALEFANPQAAGEALSKMDDARPLIVDSREDRGLRSVASRTYCWTGDEALR